MHCKRKTKPTQKILFSFEEKKNIILKLCGLKIYLLKNGAEHMFTQGMNHVTCAGTSVGLRGVWEIGDVAL